MSRYMIDKLLWEIDRSDESVGAFAEDRVEFVRRWETMPALPPHPEGGRLTDEEREAFETLDYAALYRLGAHPYLLWHVVRAVLVPEPMSIEELVAAYREEVAHLGIPDFGTWVSRA